MNQKKALVGDISIWAAIQGYTFIIKRSIIGTFGRTTITSMPGENIHFVIIVKPIYQVGMDDIYDRVGTGTLLRE